MLELRSRDHLDDPERKRHFNELLFAEVAPKYDFVTRALSFGRDHAWKRHLIAAFPAKPENPVCVDLACGTGDLCQSLVKRYPDGRIIGIDLSVDMLEVAKQRWAVESRPDDGSIDWRCGDMADTGLEDASVDLVSGSYALRNAPDLDVALAEISRILKPGGRAAFLDFSKSPNAAIAKISYGLLKFWGGFWGLLLHRNADVYGYIAESLEAFPDRRSLLRHFSAANLEIERSKLFFAGMLQLLVLRKAVGNATPSSFRSDP